MQRDQLIEKILASPYCGEDYRGQRRRIARKILSVAIDQWREDYDHFYHRSTIELDLQSRVEQNLSLGPIATLIIWWSAQAIVMTLVSALVMWWLQRRTERGALIRQLQREV